MPASEPAMTHCIRRRWAAKAVIKAWSVSRYGRKPLLPVIRHSDIEVVTDNWGRPPSGWAARSLDLLRDTVVHVSLTHDGDTAAAVAILEDAPSQG